jgi:hypothetical protein
MFSTKWLILLPALVGIAFSSSQAEAYQVGLNAVGYTITDIPPTKSDTAYIECGSDVVPFINVTFDYEQNLFGDCGWDSFMVHYTGYLQIPEHQTLQMWVASDDGGTVKIGLDEFGVWQDQGCSATEFDLSTTPADSYPLDAWFYENGGGTCFMLAWNIDDTGWTIVPPEAFTSEPPTTATTSTVLTAPLTTMPESTTSILVPTSTTGLQQTVVTVPENISSTTSSSTTTTSTTTTSTVPVTLYLPPTTTTEPSTTTTEPIPEPQSTTTTTTVEVTTTTENVTITSEQPIPTTIPENPTTSVLSPSDEAEPPLSDEELETVLDALETADKAEVQALVEQVLAKDLDTSQAASLVSSPTVLASVTSEQAVALFEEIAPEELTTAEAEAVVAAVQDAPTSVRKAFEAVLNLFQGFADNYVMTGQQVPIKTRRALIALSAVFLVTAPAPSRRK